MGWISPAYLHSLCPPAWLFMWPSSWPSSSSSRQTSTLVITILNIPLVLPSFETQCQLTTENLWTFRILKPPTSLISLVCWPLLDFSFTTLNLASYGKRVAWWLSYVSTRYSKDVEWHTGRHRLEEPNMSTVDLNHFRICWWAWGCVCVCVCVCVRVCLVSELCLILLWPYEPQSSRLLCPWDFPG